MNKKNERITRETENYLYDWIDPTKRAEAEKHLPPDVVVELRATKTVGDWHRITMRISKEIWKDASPEELDAAIKKDTEELDKLAEMLDIWEDEADAEDQEKISAKF